MSEGTKAKIDIWEGVRQQKVREYRAAGLSFDEAEDRADADVRREIRGEPTRYNARNYPL